MMSPAGGGEHNADLKPTDDHSGDHQASGHRRGLNEGWAALESPLRSAMTTKMWSLQWSRFTSKPLAVSRSEKFF
jgi:hypothetical protein